MDDPIIASPTHLEVKWDRPFRTDDVLLVAALVTIGIPWRMKKEATVSGGHHVSDRVIFHLAESCKLLPHPSSPSKAIVEYNTHFLVDKLKKGELERIDPEHPLCYAMQAILNRQSILKHINERRPVWHFKKSGGPITAIVHDGREQSMDTISRFFKRSGRHSGKVNPLL